MNNPGADYQRVIHTMKYARLKPDGQRESWFDTISRFHDYIIETQDMSADAYEYFTGTVVPMILEKRVVPSMRLLASAGPAAARENLTAFNCMFMGIDSVDSFGRLMYALMCGTGVGFSVEKMYICDLPLLPRSIHDVDDPIVVEDSREGWTEAFLCFLGHLWRGMRRRFDVSRVRPAGSPLKTTGGYASGPQPLLDLHRFIDGMFTKYVTAEYDNLLDIDVYDICCKVADVVVQGGVRRSACICLFDSDSFDMWDAKTPTACQLFPHRFNSNNSAVFPTHKDFIDNADKVFDRVKEGGEPGVVIKCTLRNKMKALGRPVHDSIGLNPCAEVILQSNQVCNLTEVILRPHLELEENMDQVEAAVFLGLLQSRMLDFNRTFMEPVVVNSEDEGLLGVSLTGMMDDPELLNGSHGLSWLREWAHLCADKWAKDLKIPKPKAITTVKPSGTVSKLVDCSAGIHPRYAAYYLSNIGIAKGSPLDRFLTDSGVLVRATTDTMRVFSFPLKSPAGALTTDDVDALDQLTLWKLVNDSWCDHNVSCTIHVGDNEWDTVKSWCLENAESLAGITFLSKFDGSGYAYMPLEAITEDQYKDCLEVWPKLDFDLFRQAYDDTTDTTAREFACAGGSCEIL